VSLKPVDSEREEEEIVAEINVTPLTDIFLVLLIIFMVTSTALVQQGTSVQLPRAGKAQEGASGVTVTATADARVLVDGKEVPLPQLETELRQALAKAGQKSVVLQGDRALVLERAVQIMTASRLAGAERISIATMPDGTAGALGKDRPGTRR
jgi:biopolymer transport protein ExbD